MLVTFEQAFEVMRYPAGESHVHAGDHLVADGDTIIAANVRGFEDLCHILTANQILWRMGRKARWFIPYFPFARHDRRRDRHDGFELGLATELLSGLDILTLDPHSDVLGNAFPHIPQSEVVRLWSYMGLFDVPNPVILIPDQGATKKADAWTRAYKFPVVQGYKKRDPQTGALSGFGIMEDDSRPLKGADVIIVDDICDAGGTFLGLAEAAVKQYATNRINSFTLAVTHGLFTKGTAPLFAKFGRIFSTGCRPADAPTTGVQFHGLSHQELYAKTERV